MHLEYYVMLCYVMLCYVMLCYVMLCYVMFERLEKRKKRNIKGREYQIYAHKYY
jgi:hypothetical protein